MRQRGFLTPDICFDVLSRLPSKALLGLKCVSKEWYRLISDRSFIQAQLQKPESISGFFYQERFKWCHDDIKTVHYIPVELETAEVREVSFDFLPEDVAVLASCNGLICCRSCFPCEDPVIYICNPANKEWIEVECAALKREENIALAFDPLRDPVRDSTYFKVVRVERLESELEIDVLQYSFDIYSSKTGLWTKSKEICQCNSDIYKNKGVFVGGVLHWLTDGEQILTFNVEEELCWLVSVPVTRKEFKIVPEVCIGECRGRLQYTMATEEGLQVWLLVDYFECRWELQRVKYLEEMEEEYPAFFCNLRCRVECPVSVDAGPWVNPLASKDGQLLMKVGLRVYLYNVDEDKMEEACHAVKLGASPYCPRVLPYATTLVPLI